MDSRLLNYSSIIIRILFFGFFYLFFLFGINPAIAYFIQQPAFFTGRTYLYEHLSYPGGLIEYLSQFITQFYYYPWFGALLLTLVVWCISGLAGALVRSIKLSEHKIALQLIPAIGLLVIHSRHEYILATSMILLSSVLFFYLYIKLTRQRLIFRSSGLILSSVALYYISGGGALLHYLLMCFIYEMFNLKNRDSRIILLLTILAGIIPYLSARFLFYITLKQAYFHLLFSEPYYHPPFILYLLFIYFPVIILYKKAAEPGFLAGMSIFKRKNTADEKRIRYLSFISQVIIVFLLTALTARFAVNPEQAFINKVKYLAYNKKWAELLEEVKQHGSVDRFVNFHTNRALYHTGKLGDDLFKYPQIWGKHSLFLGEIIIRTILMDNSDIYFDLGHTRSAQHWAYEAQTIYENSPRILKRLALTNLILGNYKAAGSILEILEKSMINKPWAMHYMQYVENPSKLEADSLIQIKRDLLTPVIFFMDRINPNIDLSVMLKSNANNRMVFEYLMAYYLLSNEIGNVVNKFSYLKDLGYKEIPRTYQEALLVFISKTKIKRINLGGYSINKNITERYKDYAGIVYKHDNDLQSAREELYREHGDTYWYYLHFVSPVTTQRELEIKTKE